VNVAAYFAHILKVFAQIMANFSALRMRPHPLHPHAIRLWWQLISDESCNTFSTMHRSDCNYLTKLLFFWPQVNVKSLMETLTLHMIVIKPSQSRLNPNK